MSRSFYDSDIVLYHGIIAEYSLIKLIAFTALESDIKLASPNEMARWIAR